jgi:hypothetical protein
MYIQATPGTMLKLITRIDGGGINSIASGHQI